MHPVASCLVASYPVASCPVDNASAVIKDHAIEQGIIKLFKFE